MKSQTLHVHGLKLTINEAIFFQYQAVLLSTVMIIENYLILHEYSILHVDMSHEV